MDEKGKQYIVDKYNKIQLEIIEIGWTGILKKYHPDNNANHPRAYDLFRLYKQIYENIKEKIVFTDYDSINNNK
jgi:hypothetical protein